MRLGFSGCNWDLGRKPSNFNQSIWFLKHRELGIQTLPMNVLTVHLLAQLIRASDGELVELCQQWSEKETAVVVFARHMG